MLDDIPTFNLKAVIRETGLTPATLRAWERRYKLPTPGRSAGGHRLYTPREVDALKWLVARRAEGLSISQAVELFRRQGGKPADLAHPAADEPASGLALESLRRDWVNACLIYNEQMAEQALNQAFAISDAERVCAEIFQKGLAELGAGWYSGQVSVQQEHFASALAMRRLHTLFAGCPPPSRPGRILAACPPGEHHEFVLLTLAYLLRRRGWSVVYLGANVPIPQLDAAVRLTAPDMILSAAQTLVSAAALAELGDFALQHNIPLIFGGGIFNRAVFLQGRIPGHFLGETMEGVAPAVEQWMAQPPVLPPVQPPAPAISRLLSQFLNVQTGITAGVSDRLKSSPLDPASVEEAAAYLTRNLVAALRLGDLGLLDEGSDWVKGLLGNRAIPLDQLDLFYAAYHQAVQEHLGAAAAPILSWLLKTAPGILSITNSQEA